MSGDGEDVGRKKRMESREIQKRRDLAQLVVQPAAHHSSTQLHQLVKRGRRRELVPSTASSRVSSTTYLKLKVVSNKYI